MKKILALLLSLVSLTSLNAQNKLDNLKNSDRKHTSESTIYVGDTYENLSLIAANGVKLKYRIATDKKIVKPGEEFNLKVLFASNVTKVEIYTQMEHRLLATATEEDIAKGSFVTTIKADDFGRYYIYIHSTASQQPMAYAYNIIIAESPLYDDYIRREVEAVSTLRGEELEQFYRKLASETSRIKFQARQGNNFETLSTIMSNGQHVDYKMMSNRIIATPGDTVLLKIVFNPEVVSRVVVEGIGETTAEDVANGQFVVAMVSQVTTVYNVSIYRKDGTYVPMCGRVIIVDDDEYDFMRKQEQYAKSRGRDVLYQFYDKLAGGPIVEPTKK